MRYRGGIWGFYIYARGRSANWIVSVVFMLVGLLIAIALPPIIRPMPDRDVVVLIVRLLGGIFFILGLVIFASMMFDAVLASEGPEVRDRWYRSSKLVLSLIAAGLFAIPATMAFPIMMLAYLSRPNGLFPINDPNPLNNLVVGLVFSVVGVLALGLMVVAARSAQPS